MERIYGPIANKLTMAQREPLWTEFAKQEETLAQQVLFKSLQDSIYNLFNSDEFIQSLNRCLNDAHRDQYLCQYVRLLIDKWKIKFVQVIKLDTLHVNVICDINRHGNPVIIDYGANLCLLQKGEADVNAWPGSVTKEMVVEAFENFLKGKGYSAPEVAAVAEPVQEAVAAKPKFKVKPLVWKSIRSIYNLHEAEAGTSPLVLRFQSHTTRTGNRDLTVITNIDVTPESSCEYINPPGGYASLDEAKAAAEQFIMDAFNDLMVTDETTEV